MIENSGEKPTILALDTSSKATSMAVAHGGTMLKTIRQLADQKRSETLWSEVGSLLEELGKSIRDVDVFAVCTGPGGFTGLRVGMGAFMGFAASASKPLIGVTSLEAAAFGAKPAQLVCAMVNAYKNEVYSQTFGFDSDGGPVARNQPMVSTLEKALDRVSGETNLVFAGDAAEANAQEIARFAASFGQVQWSVERPGRSLAESIALLANLKYERGEAHTGSSLKACYVRPSEAEIKLSMGLLGSKIKRVMKP